MKDSGNELKRETEKEGVRRRRRVREKQEQTGFSILEETDRQTGLRGSLKD